MATRSLLRLLWVSIPLGATSLGCGCGSKTPPASESAQGSPEVNSDGTPAPPPLPPDAPKLAALALKTMVYEHSNDKSRELGYVRIGQAVARSDKPATAGGGKCPDGWYQVSPRGFVCAGPTTASTDLNHKIVRALGVKPDMSKPMPYPYGFVRRDATLWNFLPYVREMDKYEYAFQGHLKEYAQKHKSWNRIDRAGANHVPLDEHGNAKMLPKDVPPTPPQLDEEHLFPQIGDGTIPWWLVNTHPNYRDATRRHIPNVSSFDAPDKSPYRGKIYRHAGVAIIGSFRSGDLTAGRKFVVTLDGRLIGEDKVKPHYASAFHGMAVTEATKFPFAIIRRREAFRYNEGGVKTGTKLGFREIVELTGKSQLWHFKAHWQTTAGYWVKEDEAGIFTGTPEAPKNFDYKREKWIDVSITYQTLTAYEGTKPVYVTLVSSGADGDGDPYKTKSTIRGEFRIDYKHVTSTMDADDPESRFELRDVPWVQYFEGGFAIHGAYWHDDFGRPRSHGCVNLSPVDARRIFMWTDPPLPDGWHAVKSGPTMGEGTWVRVRR